MIEVMVAVCFRWLLYAIPFIINILDFHIDWIIQELLIDDYHLSMQWLDASNMKSTADYCLNKILATVASVAMTDCVQRAEGARKQKKKKGVSQLVKSIIMTIVLFNIKAKRWVVFIKFHRKKILYGKY